MHVQLRFNPETLHASAHPKRHQAAKVEARLNLATGGYNKRASALLAGINEALNALDEMNLEVGCFRRLKAIEDVAVGRRLAKLQAEVGAHVYDSTLRSFSGALSALPGLDWLACY